MPQAIVCAEGHPTRRPREGEMQHPCGCVALGMDPESEQRIRSIVREEIAAFFRNLRTQTISGGSLSYREYLHTRDEPPAAPPMPTINTTERL